MPRRSTSQLAVLALGAVGLAATVLGTLAVVSRYAFSLPISVSDEVVTYLIVWALLLGVGLGECEDTHIRATILIDKLGPPGQLWANRLTLLLTLVFAAMLAWYGGQIAYQRLALGEVSATMLQFPQWIARASIPVGFAIVFLAATARLRRRSPPPAATP